MPAPLPASGQGTTLPDAGALTVLPNEGLIARYLVGVENFDRRVFELADAQLDTAFLPDAGVGRWPIRVLLGHLADAELVNTHRMRRAAAEENPVFALWDENAFIDAGMYGGPGTGARYPIGGLVAVVHTLRKWTAEWLGTLAPEHWSRSALHPERGPQNVRTLVEGTVHHLEHHAWFLNRKVELLMRAQGHGRGVQ